MRDTAGETLRVDAFGRCVRETTKVAQAKLARSRPTDPGHIVIEFEAGGDAGLFLCPNSLCARRANRRR